MLNSFQNTYTNTQQPNIDKSEGEKVSYWLKKLQKQEGEKVHADDDQKVDKTLEEEGQDQQVKNLATKKEVDKQMVNDLVKKSNRCIIRISSIFPLNIFPSTIIVEESRVTFIFRQFMAFQSHSVEIKDISNIFIDSSLFFASLRIVSRTYFKNDIRIDHLNKTKASRVRMVIEGLRTFEEHNISTSNFEIDELIAKIEEFHINRLVN